VPRREQPLESGDSALLRFAADLRQLREQAGSPTYRQLSTRAHYSVATLSEAAGGRKLPSLAVTLAYVRACGGDPDSWAARWREVTTGIADSEQLDKNGSDPPYVGLATFQRDDSGRFFGRETLVTELVQRVTEHRFLAVFGASGSGKSSLLRAGLAARFASHEIALITPGPRPIEECAVRLSSVLKESAATLRAELATDPRNLHLRIRQAEIDLLLIVDQFEELFTLCPDETERLWLIDALTTAAFAETSRTRVVLGVRADFYGHCGQHQRLLEAIRDTQVLVGPMTADELRRAITEPAAQAGCRVETALVARLVADAAGQPAALPMVSHALLETWRRRRGTTLTLAGYESVGGVQHALSRTAEDIYAELDEQQREVAKRIFLRLIALGDGTEDTKRRIGRHELGPDTDVVLDRLASARLVTIDRDTVELTHEALIRHWPRLRGWLAEDRDGQRIHHDLADATNAWESLGRDPGALYRGARLARAHTWANARDTALNARERDFLHTSLATETLERSLARRRTRRSKQLVALLAVLLLIASATTGYALSSQRTATEQRNAALAQNALREAGRLQVTNPALARQLALAAYRLDPSLTARDTLLEMFATPYAARLTGYTSAVTDVAVSPDGTLVGTATPDTRTEAKLWDVRDRHRPRELPGLPTAASSIAFHPKAPIAATFGTGDAPRLWDLTDRENPRGLTLPAKDRPEDVGTAITFSPDGTILATANTDRRIRLWDVSDLRNPKHLLTLEGTGGGSGPGASVVFSPDGRTLAATTREHTVGLWDVSDPRRPVALPVKLGVAGVLAVEFSPDGRLLATVGAAGASRLWDVRDPRRPAPLAPLTGHTDDVNAVAFSADGRLVATGSADRRTRVWDIADPSAPIELVSLTGQTDAVRAVAFAANGRTLVTGSADRTARLEDISSIGLASHTDSVYAISFSRDGSMIATASGERSLRLWNITERDHPIRLGMLVPKDTWASMAFSPNGRSVVAVGREGNAQTWDISTPREPRPPVSLSIPGILTIAYKTDGRMIALARKPAEPSHDGTPADQPVTMALKEVYVAAWGPDNRVVATANESGVSVLWDATDPAQPRATATLPVPGYPMAFSTDGRLLATVHPDGTTRLWDVSDRTQPVDLGTIASDTRTDDIPGPSAKVAFSADGRRLVTAGGDGTARLWDIADPRHPIEEATLRGHSGEVLAVAFHPDGHTIATAGNDHVVRLWESDVERLADQVCAIAYPRITKAEWKQYFGGLEYRPPCR
jgi:WD40 repeat protein